MIYQDLRLGVQPTQELVETMINTYVRDIELTPSGHLTREPLEDDDHLLQRRNLHYAEKVQELLPLLRDAALPQWSPIADASNVSPLEVCSDEASSYYDLEDLGEGLQGYFDRILDNVKLYNFTNQVESRTTSLFVQDDEPATFSNHPRCTQPPATEQATNIINSVTQRCSLQASASDTNLGSAPSS